MGIYNLSRLKILIYSATVKNLSVLHYQSIIFLFSLGLTLFREKTLILKCDGREVHAVKLVHPPNTKSLATDFLTFKTYFIFS